MCLDSLGDVFRYCYTGRSKQVHRVSGGRLSNARTKECVELFVSISVVAFLGLTIDDDECTLTRMPRLTACKQRCTVAPHFLPCALQTWRTAFFCLCCASVSRCTSVSSYKTSIYVAMLADIFSAFAESPVVYCTRRF